MLADNGLPPDGLKLKQEIQAKRAEWERVRLRVLYVEAWLDGLLGVERWVVQQHIIEGYPWRIVTSHAKEFFGEEKSLGALKHIQRKALSGLQPSKGR